MYTPIRIKTTAFNVLRRVASWVGALGLMLTGLGLFERSRRQFVRQWAQLAQGIEPDAPHREAA